MIFLKKDDKICVLVKSPFLENTVCAAAGLWDSVFPTLEVLVQKEEAEEASRAVWKQIENIDGLLEA